MATVRIYKVAELLGTSSQEVMTLLKRAHGIEVKSASSTIEEVVARQFVERLARERGVALPSSAAMFADTPVVKGRKGGGGGRPVEPPKPAQSLPPPRLIKTIRPPAPAVPADAADEFAATDAETPAFEPPVPEEAPAAAAPPPEIVTEPPSAATRAYAKAPTSEPAVQTLPEPSLEVTDAAVDEDISAATQPGEAPSAPVPPPPPPSAPGRIVPPTLRLRVEEPGGARIVSRPVPSRLAVPPARPRAQPTQPQPQPQPRAAQPGPGAAPETRAARPAGAPPAPPQAARPPAAPSTTVRIAPPTPPVTRPATPAPTQARTATPTYRPTYTPSVRPSTGHTGQTLIVPPGARPGQTVYRPNQPPAARAVQPAVGRPPQYGRPGGGRRSSSGPRDRDRSGGGIAAPVAPPPVTRTITLAEGMTVKDLADKLDIKAKDVLRKLLEKRMMMTINTTLDTDTATTIAREFGADVQMRTFEEELVEVESENARSEDVVTRAPVVTVMGHVDHGKTTLLDAIRETRVAEREAGGITQHIGAYAVQVNSRNVVFLDTPGHEAFTMMRARGAGVTDVVILVVAADDGVMPQTREAIDHAKAAGVPIIVAINKIDKADSNPDRVKKELADLGLVPEDWGGQTVTVNVSAKKRENLDLLLEMILLVTEIGELKANPKRSASGTVLEAKLDRGRGPVATVLVQDGTLNVGDTVIAGTIVGKVRALIDDRGHPVRQAGPSTPVEVLGLGGLPQPGDTFQSLADAARARQIAMFRQNQAKERALGSRATRLTLESLQKQIAAGEAKELPLIIKADVQGSAEVLASSLTKLSDDRVKVRIIHAGVGAINESDALLASASNAIIIGFNVRPDRNAADLAERESVDIRLHSVIYDVTDEMKKAMAGLLEPTVREVRLGSAEVRQTFKVPKFGTVAGCMVTDGRIMRSGDSQARLLRDNVVVYEGKLGSLRRFKDDVSEVKTGLECGIAFERFNDIKVGDVIEVFTVERVAATV